MSGTKDLKPCPFCGSKDLHPVFDHTDLCIECRWCGAIGPDPHDQRDQSKVITWDSRPIEDDLRAEIRAHMEAELKAYST